MELTVFTKDIVTPKTSLHLVLSEQSSNLNSKEDALFVLFNVRLKFGFKYPLKTSSKRPGVGPSPLNSSFSFVSRNG